MTNDLPMHAQLAPGISEHVFQTRITDLCRWIGLRWHHETDSRRTRRGFLDLVIVGRPGNGVIFAELKRNAREKPTPEQSAWMRDLRAAGGVEVYLWTPDDWPEINRRLHALAGRRVPQEFL